MHYQIWEKKLDFTQEMKTKEKEQLVVFFVCVFYCDFIMHSQTKAIQQQ